MNTCRQCKFYKPLTASCGPLIIGRRLTELELLELDVKHYKKKYRLCGCYLPAKTWGIFETCPIGKWGVHALSEGELAAIIEFVDNLPHRGTYGAENVRELNKWYKLLTGTTKNISGCPDCVRTLVRTFRREIAEYKEKKLLNNNNNDER